MMVIKRVIRAIAGMFRRLDSWSSEKEEKIYLEGAEPQKKPDALYSLWDHLRFKENTQAEHLASVLGFEEWVDMVEIRRRIKEIFGAEYKNERSLYPYLKTLVDIGVMETSSVGGKRRWRKRDLLIKGPAKEARTTEGKQKAKAGEIREKEEGE